MTTITMLFHGATAALCYGTWTSTLNNGGTAFMLGMIGSGLCFTVGVWVLLFAGDGRMGKSGRDKRTSGLLFKDRKGKTAVLKDL